MVRSTTFPSQKLQSESNLSAVHSANLLDSFGQAGSFLAIQTDCAQRPRNNLGTVPQKASTSFLSRPQPSLERNVCQFRHRCPSFDCRPFCTRRFSTRRNFWPRPRKSPKVRNTDLTRVGSSGRPDKVPISLRRLSTS